MSDNASIDKHKIMSMETEKREKLLNAAMKEFCKGFKNASTDKIAREAGVSKGLLFHYFGTKENLYQFVTNYSFDKMISEYYGLIDLEQTDLLERLWQMILLKFDLMHKYPALFEFGGAVYTGMADAPTDDFAKRFKATQAEILLKLSGNVDTSLFREDIDPIKASSIIYWSMLGYANTKVGRGKTTEDYRNEYDKYLLEIKDYFDIFRKTFYR